MHFHRAPTYLAVLLATSLLAGCQGNNTVTQTSGDGTPVEGGGGDSGDGGKTSATATVVADVAGTLGSAGDLVRSLGTTISQQDLPIVNSVTSGTGEVLMHTGDAVDSLASGLNNGLGSLTANDNALGTTLAGVSGATSDVGEGVTALGSNLDLFNSLPVFAQLDGESGLLTDLGNTVSGLGITVTEVSDTLSLALTEEGGALNGLTTELTGVVRPLIGGTEEGTQFLGQALVVGPTATNLLQQAGSAVVVLGDDLSGNNNAVLASAGGAVQGVGQLVADAGGLLSLTEGEGEGETLDLGSLLAGLDGNDNPLNGLTGGNDGLLDPVTNTLAGLSGADGGLLDPVTDTVDGLLGGLSGTDGGLLDPVTDTVDGLLGGLSDTDGGLLDPVTDTVDGLTGGLSGTDDGLLDPVTDLLGGLSGGLPSSDLDANDGLIDSADDALLDPLLGGLL